MPSSHIVPSGGLFTHHFLEAIQQPSFSYPAASPDSFALPGESAPSPSGLENRIATAWELLTERWDSIENRISGIDISTLRERWLLPLFSLLDLDLDYQRADLILDDDLRFPISYLGRASGDISRYLIPIHTVLPAGEDSLEARPKHGGRGLKSLAPHDMLQRFLNFSPEYKWGILNDGLRLRILRDYHHTYTRGYVEFDLQGIFSTRDFAAFRALYRLAHASRFIPPSPEVGRGDGGEGEDLDPPIEKFYQHALSTGIKVGEDLRKNVQEAIEKLANGFLRATPGLLAYLQINEGELHYSDFGDLKPVDAFFHDILTTIYRMLFLLFAEQRGMLPGRGSLYMDEFSLTALRARAERPLGEDPNLDLWERLKTTFHMVEKGAPELDIFGYNGALFHRSRTPLLMPNDSPLPELGEGLGVGADSQCRNDALLRAVRYLTTVEREGVLQRVSYADLSVEEIGSIYESLLDFTPRVSRTTEQLNGREIPPATFFLDPRGSARKTTGSYYTHPSLVNELIKSALIPVMEDRLKEAVPGIDLEHPEALAEEERKKAEGTILALKVVDPAAGSGAFLIAATNTLGLHLAQVRSGDLYPSEREIRTARRDVLAQCIYAVDVNPMAVELCKVSLWINAAVDDAPLSFLDHHIKCGNSLIGASPDLLAKGVPDDAFQPVTGDDKDVARSIRAGNKAERQGQLNLFSVNILRDHEDLKQWRNLAQLAKSNPQVAEQRYREYLTGADYRVARLPADLWTAAFFWHLANAGTDPPTTETVFQAQADSRILPNETTQRIKALSNYYRFFHWYLEFPEVFNNRNHNGFDVILGNPPWERIKLQEKEFFDGRDEVIKSAPRASIRRNLIRKLKDKNPALWQDYRQSLRDSEATSKFLRNSGKFPLTGVGDINTYAVFAGLARHLVSRVGRVGIVIPLGIATDYTYRNFFADLMETGSLLSFYDFENREGIFPGVHRNYNFSLTTLTGTEKPEYEPEFAFFLTKIDHLRDDERRFTLTLADLRRINPNTLTCPIFNNRRDANLAQKIYRICPILHNESEDINPWGIEFYTMFHMANDSGIFFTEEQLRNGDCRFVGNCFVSKSNDIYLPLYEAKMMHQFNHRHGTYEGQTTVQVQKGLSRDLGIDESSDITKVASPRYWVKRSIVEEKLNEKIHDYGWLLGLRDVTRAVDRRTAQFAVLPLVAVGHKIPILFLNRVNAIEDCIFESNVNSFVLDFIVRQKIGGISLSYYIIRQLPVFPPGRYTNEHVKWIVPRVLELTYAAWDLKSFADDVWADGEANEESRSAKYVGLRNVILEQWENNAAEVDGGHTDMKPPDWLGLIPSVKDHPNPFPYPPFKWDEDRRARLRADLDGLYAHLYGLTRDEFDYILDTFPIVRRKDEEKYGEYRTKRLVLEAYDEIASRDDYEELIPAEARARSQESALVKSYTSISGANPDTTLAKPTKPADSKSKPSRPKKQSDETIALAQESRVEENPPATPLPLSDYSLYRCPKCGKQVLGFDRASHTREVHGGNEPGYVKCE
jgi:hypothetical protein